MKYIQKVLKASQVVHLTYSFVLRIILESYIREPTGIIQNKCDNTILYAFSDSNPVFVFMFNIFSCFQR